MMSHADIAQFSAKTDGIAVDPAAAADRQALCNKRRPSKRVAFL